jgi:SAM-dependent methyltransferase
VAARQPLVSREVDALVTDESYRRVRCGLCDGDQLQSVLDMGDSPPANGDDVKKYPLTLGICRRCCLLQQLTVVPDDLLFGGTYHFYSSASAPKVRYHQELAEVLWGRHLTMRDHPTVVELACNDGDLLRHFKTRGATTLGVEPARGPATTAWDRGLDVLPTAFTAEFAEMIAGMHPGGVDLVIANHVLAHIVDVNDFVLGIRRILGPHGVAVIEVQYARDMLVGNQFDHVYHEHRYHWTVTTLNELFSRHGLYIHDVEWVEPQGGSLRVTFAKFPEARSAPQDARIQQMLSGEYWMAHPSAYRDLQGRVNWIRDRLVRLIETELDENRVVAGYGATAKSVSLMNFCELDTDQISYVVDTTPHKIGRLVPGTNIPIVAPEDVPATAIPDTYVMWAWNYVSHILRKEELFTANGGRWIVPIPYPTVI